MQRSAACARTRVQLQVARQSWPSRARCVAAGGRRCRACRTRVEGAGSEAGADRWRHRFRDSGFVRDSGFGSRGDSLVTTVLGTVLTLVVMVGELMRSRDNERVLRRDGAAEPPDDVYRP